MLNLYEILQNVLLKESVSSDSVNDAIDNKYQVIINYSDEKNRAPKKRIIEPYAYGLSKAGNEVVRAYQYNGDTYRGIPKWKLFRLDRIKSWNPTDKHFNMSPSERGWNAEEYNSNGDETMSMVYNQVSFENNGEELYSPNNRLNIARKNTANLKNSKPININQMSDTKTDNNIDFNDKKIKDMIKRNLKITDMEKARRNWSLSKKASKNNDIKSVINNNNNNNNNNEPAPIENSLIKDIKTDNNIDFNDKKIKDMIKRNLKITDKEKARRNWSLSKKAAKNNDIKSVINNNSNNESAPIENSLIKDIETDNNTNVNDKKINN